MLALGGFFLLSAFLYSLVGFGGGSTYVALCASYGLSYKLIPQIGLLCNLLVTSIGTWKFYQKKYLDLNFMTPFVLTSIPCSFLGGLYPISKKMFLILISLTLFLSGIRLLFIKEVIATESRPPSKKIVYLVGGGIGLLSGVIGIGGGIFLSPLMINLKWADSKKVAAGASFFILVNSLSGLIGQMIKAEDILQVTEYWPLFLSVILGGLIGTTLSVHQKFSPRWIKILTAILVLWVSGRLYLKI
jgi:uncharacterized protein